MRATATGMVARRYESVEADPSTSIDLRADHPALREARTIFPTSVVGSMESPRFLVSGANNPKLGGAVVKGPRKGWPIYHLTLEERATCPPSCHAWASCYGNAMHLARRHRVDDDFIEVLRAEVVTVARQHPGGLLIRLHTLGDFFSVPYVLMWAELLEFLPQLYVFGYTARDENEDDPESRRIARAVRLLSELNWEAFAVRFSRSEPGPQRATIVEDDDAPGVIVCPAQTGQTEACASCGLCWAAAARDKCIGFLRHGMRRHEGPRRARVQPTPKIVRSPAPPPVSTPPVYFNLETNAAKVREALQRLGATAASVQISIAELALEAGIPSGSMGAALWDLEKVGRVQITRGQGPGRRAPNEYRLKVETDEGPANEAAEEQEVPEPPMLPAGPAPVQQVEREQRRPSTFGRSGGAVRVVSADITSGLPPLPAGRSTIPRRSPSPDMTRALMGDPAPGRLVPSEMSATDIARNNAEILRKATEADRRELARWGARA